MDIDITQIVQAVIALIAAVITAFVVPWIKSKTSQVQQDTISVLVSAAVEAAEQVYTGSGRGAEKKAYVVQWLKDRGITLDTEYIDAMIEAAVYELKQD